MTNKIIIQIELPIGVLEDVLDNKEVKIKLQSVLSTSQTQQVKILEKEKKKRSAKVKYTLTFEEKEIIAAWNNNPFIKQLENDRGYEQRFYPMSDKDIYDSFFLDVLRRVLRVIDGNTILDEIECYLSKCQRGLHIWGSANHGTKNLKGFLAILIKLNKDKKKGWWYNAEGEQKDKIIEDEEPETTRLIADMFANHFLGQKEFDLEQGTREYRKFVQTRRKLEKFALDRKLDKRFSKKEVIGLLLKAVDSAFKELNGGTVYPSHLANDQIWKIIFPQYLVDQGMISGK